MLRKDKAILWIALGAIATLILALIAIFNWAEIKPHGNMIRGENSFEVKIYPLTIYQGIYDYNNPLDFKLTILPKANLNITSIKIKEDNFEIVRDITGEKLSVRWKNDHSNYIFDSSRSSYYKLIDKEFSIYGCNNCFFGENRDYNLRMIIEYSVDGIPKPPVIIEKIIDVV